MLQTDNKWLPSDSSTQIPLVSDEQATVFATVLVVPQLLRRVYTPELV